MGGAKLPAMKKAGLAVLFFSLLAGSQCAAQLMEPAEYRAYLKRLDAAVSRWQPQFEAMNVEKMDLGYAVGKTLEMYRDIIRKNLALMHESIGLQFVRESLSQDITLESSLVEVVDDLGNIVNNLPENERGVYWGRSLVPLSKEMREFDPPLRKHVGAYADQLQARAERCSK